MYIDRKYQIEIAAAPVVRGNAGTLTHVLIERRLGRQGVAVAMDGWIAAAVPVELEDADICGVFPAEWSKLARRQTPKSESRIRLILGDGAAGMPNGEVLTHG